MVERGGPRRTATQEGLSPGRYLSGSAPLPGERSENLGGGWKTLSRRYGLRCGDENQDKGEIRAHRPHHGWCFGSEALPRSRCHRISFLLTNSLMPSSASSRP